MSRRLSSRVRVLLSLAIAVATFALVVPAAASAGQADWTLRPSWVTYVGRWGGRTTAIPTASYSGGVVSTTQVGTGSGSTASYDGGFNSVVPLHFIDLGIEDISIDFSTGNVTGSGWYTPFLGTRRTFSGWHLVTLTGGTRSGTNPKEWIGASAILTANGATVFNGGSNGSYRQGEQFGTIDALGDF